MYGRLWELVETKLVPADGHYVKVRDLTVYYEMFGSGEPLVLLHGGTISGRKNWERFVPTFSEHFKVIIPDSRGHGKTDNPAGELSFRLLADDTSGLIHALGLERPSVCGYSDGGQVCLELGMSHPEVAGKLVIVGGHNRLTDADREELRSLGIEGPGKVDIERFKKAAPELISRIKEFSNPYGPDYWKSYIRQISKMWLTQLNYTKEDYRKIIVPTLIAVGDRDADVRLEDGVEMYRSIPKAELAVALGSDHFFPWSKIELFTKTVIDFLQHHRVPQQP